MTNFQNVCFYTGFVMLAIIAGAILVKLFFVAKSSKISKSVGFYLSHMSAKIAYSFGIGFFSKPFDSRAIGNLFEHMEFLKANGMRKYEWSFLEKIFSDGKIKIMANLPETVFDKSVKTDVVFNGAVTKVKLTKEGKLSTGNQTLEISHEYIPQTEIAWMEGYRFLAVVKDNKFVPFYSIG